MKELEFRLQNIVQLDFLLLENPFEILEFEWEMGKINSEKVLILCSVQLITVCLTSISLCILLDFYFVQIRNHFSIPFTIFDEGRCLGTASPENEFNIPLSSYRQFIRLFFYPIICLYVADYCMQITMLKNKSPFPIATIATIAIHKQIFF